MFREQLKKFSELVQPIELALSTATDALAHKSAAQTGLLSQQLTKASSAPDTPIASELTRDNSSFFNFVASDLREQKLQLERDSGSANLQTTTPAPSKQLDDLSQNLFESRVTAFSKLSPREQALARVGGLLYTHREEIGPRVYHFIHQSTLIAVLDRVKGGFYLRNELYPADYSEVFYTSKPDAGGATTNLFEKIPYLDAVWWYAQHDPEALLDLPAQLNEDWLQLQALPTVSPRLLTAEHMLLISRLLRGEQRFANLIKGLAKPQQMVFLSSLVCLLLTRSVLLTQEPLKGNRVVTPLTVSVR